MLAVKGFCKVKVALAMPVFTISVGNTRAVDKIKFW